MGMNIRMRGIFGAAAVAVLALASACNSNSVSGDGAASKSGCQNLAGSWKMTALKCNGNDIDLNAAGVVSIRTTFSNSGKTTQTVATLASGCTVTDDSNQTGANGASLTMTPVNRACGAACSGQECDGAVGAVENWTCSVSASGKELTLSANGTQMCNNTKTVQTWTKE